MPSLFDCSPSVSSIGFKLLPSVDASQPMTAVPSAGDVFMHSGSNAVVVDASYTGAGGSTINKDNVLVFDGTNWVLIPV